MHIFLYERDSTAQTIKYKPNQYKVHLLCYLILKQCYLILQTIKLFEEVIACMLKDYMFIK